MKNIYKLIISVLIPVVIWASVWFLTSDSINNWYAFLEKPFFNPPNWVFWPVWSILYIMIWLSFFLVWKKWFWKNSKKIIWVYSAQLFFNFTWSFSFFYFENPLLWLINIILLLFLIIHNIYLFYWIDKKSAYLLVPYLLWVSFATLLNLAILVLN